MEEMSRSLRRDSYAIGYANAVSALFTILALYVSIFPGTMQLIHPVFESKLWNWIPAVLAGGIAFWFSWSIERKLINPAFQMHLYTDNWRLAKVCFILVPYYVMVFFISTATSTLAVAGSKASQAAMETAAYDIGESISDLSVSLKAEQALIVSATSYASTLRSLEADARRGTFTDVSGPGKLQKTFAQLAGSFESFAEAAQQRHNRISTLLVRADSFLVAMRTIVSSSELSVEEKREAVSPIVRSLNSLFAEVRSLSVLREYQNLSSSLPNLVFDYGGFDRDQDVAAKQRGAMGNLTKLLADFQSQMNDLAGSLPGLADVSANINENDFVPYKAIFLMWKDIVLMWAVMLVIDSIGLFLFAFRLIVREDAEDYAFQAEEEIT